MIVKKARLAAGFSTKIEVECRNLDEAIGMWPRSLRVPFHEMLSLVLEACAAGAEIIMLDNYTAEGLKIDAGA